jgi:hypothetical protein
VGVGAPQALRHDVRFHRFHASGGIGVGTAPGQVLQPINELVDQFATAMLAASVAFGVQRVLLDVGGS